MNTRIALARSFLFVPATRPERFVKALESGADCVIVDLEDAVPSEQKSPAREQLGEGLRGLPHAQLARTLVRINAAGTPWHGQDVRLVGEWVGRGLAGAMVPKAETPTALRSIGVALGPAARLVPLVESLAGLDAVDLIARTPQVARLAFGHLDFQLDLGMHCAPGEAELLPARFRLVAASRRAQLPPPVDGVTTETGSGERLLADTQRSRAFGFTGKLCIHPTQVRTVNDTLSPSDSEVEWARRVLEGARVHQGQAFSLDGRMVDLPVIRAAKKMMLQAHSAAVNHA